MTRDAIPVCLAQMASRLFALACLVAMSAVTVQAQEFSADIVARRDGASVSVGRLSARDGKVRIETAEHPDGFFLMDAAKPSAYFVRPAARVFMDAKQSNRLTRLFVPVDPDAPCPQWQAMARVAGVSGEGDWRCERTGEETIDGRNTVAVKVLSVSGHDYSAWIDRLRKFPLRIETDDGVLFTLEAIRDQPQPAAAFELPQDFGKFSPEALIERIKQSDVLLSAPADAAPPRP